MTNQCSTCFFARPRTDVPVDGRSFDLECHFAAPVAEIGVGEWPGVPDTQWCGHFSVDGTTLGPPGPQGPQGIQGDPGPTGPAGPGSDFVVPLGGLIEYTGSTEPAGGNFVFPYGQAISRTTYATYFALVGTTYGIGDGSTTFNVVDKRGRVTAGLGNMGGSSSGRLTSPAGDTIGAAGGAQSVSSSAQTMPSRSGDFSGIPGGADFVPTSTTMTPGAATSVVQPTIVLPVLLRIR